MLALEVVPLPVSDVDGALRFYTLRVGFNLDVDYRPTGSFRVVQLTPPGSSCSIHLIQRDGSAPLRDLCLVTDNLERAHRELSSRGVQIGAPGIRIRSTHGRVDGRKAWTLNAATIAASPISAIPTGTRGQYRSAATDSRETAPIVKGKELEMGLSWQQGPLSGASLGRFLTPGPLPERLLFAEPLRRRMRVRFAGEWIADSEDVVLLHEPGRYPVA